MTIPKKEIRKFGLSDADILEEALSKKGAVLVFKEVNL